MNKKVIALILSCVMLVSASPAVAAEDAPVKPTVEEILNEYHQKAFEAQSGEDTATTYSNRSGSGSKTLEQETVDALNAAGYEAYNVTASNYEALETELKTDFGSMGLDPSGSYILAISGEDNSDSQNPNARVGMLPEQDIFDDGGGGQSFFAYTYEGQTYWMRYVTVTADINHSLGLISTVDLLDRYDVNDAWNSLNVPITVMTSLGLLPYTGTIYSLFSLVIPDTESPTYSSLLYQGASNWTIKYIQVYDFNKSEWKLCGGVEYVTMRHFLINTYYDPSLNAYDTKTTIESLPTQYSNNYYNITQAKNDAVLAFINDGLFLDTVDYVEYSHGSNVVITHHRWPEPFSYEPA